MRLVIPIDRSERDAIIIPFAAYISLPLAAQLAIVHIVPHPKSLIPGALREAQAYADTVAEEMKAAGLEAESFVGSGDPATLILQLVQDVTADMVIMATRGTRGVRKIMLGSVADDVLRLCPVPILLVNADASIVAQAVDQFSQRRTQVA